MNVHMAFTSLSTNRTQLTIRIMKARVKATGEIVEVRGIYTPTFRAFGMEEIDSYDLEGVEVIADPDYWTRLEHQYAGMAMQGILANYGVEPLPDDAANNAREYAHALVEMMKYAFKIDCK